MLAVLAVAVGLLLPRLDSARFRADANVRLVRTALEDAQRIAHARGHDVLLSFDTAAGRIRLARDSDNSHSLQPGEIVEWRGLTDGVSFSPARSGLAGRPVPAVGGESLVTLDGMPTLFFHPRGFPSSGLEVYLEVSGDRAAASRAVALVRETGQLLWYRKKGAQWKRGGR